MWPTRICYGKVIWMLLKVNALIKNLVSDFVDDEIMTRSGALAFYTSLAIAPLVVLTVVTLSMIGVDLQDEFVREINSAVGAEAGDLLRSIITAANSRPDLKSVSGVIGIVGLLASASFIFVELQDTLNLIFKVPKKNTNKTPWMNLVKDFFINRLMSIGMMIIFIFIFIGSIVVSTVIVFFYSGESGFFYKSTNFLISLIIFTLLFALMFKWMPDRRITFHSALQGGAFTAFLFLVGKALIGLYIAKSAVGSAYGAAGSLLVTLVWVYYNALVVFLGAEVSFLVLEKNRPRRLNDKN
jgi:membrane protein